MRTVNPKAAQQIGITMRRRTGAGEQSDQMNVRSNEKAASNKTTEDFFV